MSELLLSQFIQLFQVNRCLSINRWNLSNLYLYPSWFAHFWTQFSHLWCSSGEDSSILKRGKNNCFTEKCPYSLKALKAFYVKAVVPL